MTLHPSKIGVSPAPIPPRFTVADAERAYDEWGCNCGPAALAAICGATLDEVRPIMSTAGFEKKRYTNPTMMVEALRAVGRPWQLRQSKPASVSRFPDWGLVRIQWEGPWTEPGVPMRARYRYTHWIGAARRRSDGATGIFDINQLANGSGWGALEDWRAVTAPWLAGLYPRATGGWHITHAIEVER